jgi:excisionase family DNA binding protein
MTETLQMLTPKAVAEILGVHPKTVHLWLRNGKLKGVKISYRAWRIPRSALDQFIEQNSNVVPRKDVKEPQGEGRDSSSPTTSSPEPLPDNHDSPQAKMKHYIRDIMGEQLPEKNQSE